MRIFGIQLTPNDDELHHTDDDRDGDDDDLVDGRHDAEVDESDLPVPLSARAAADNVEGLTNDEMSAADAEGEPVELDEPQSPEDDVPVVAVPVASPRKGKKRKKRKPKGVAAVVEDPGALTSDESAAAPREDLRALFPEVQWRDVPVSDPLPEPETPPTAESDSPVDDEAFDAVGDTAVADAVEEAGTIHDVVPPAENDEIGEPGIVDDVAPVEEPQSDANPLAAGGAAKAKHADDAFAEAATADLVEPSTAPAPAWNDPEPTVPAGPPVVAHPLPAGDDARTRVRLGMLALAVAAVVAGVTIPTLPVWQTKDAVVAEAPAATGATAVAWLDANVDRGDPIAVADQLQDTVIAAGWQSSDVFTREPGEPIPAAADWVVATASETLLDQGSVAVATFGDGSDAVVVRAVVPGGTEAYRAAEVDRTAQGQQYGAELVENSALVVDETDRALITEGNVDSRILLDLGAFTSAGPVEVDGFPVVDGEATTVRRTVTLSEVGDQQLVRDGALTTAGIAIVQALADDFSPATASFTDDALTLRYPLDLGTTTTPEESS